MNFITQDNMDFNSNIEKSMRRIGDVGKESQEYLDAAYNGLANDDLQDAFAGEDNRLQRMIYDKTINDGDAVDKSHETVKEEISKITEFKVKDILNAFDKNGFTLDITETHVSDKPIVK